MRLRKIQTCILTLPALVVFMGCQQSSEPLARPLVAPTPLHPGTQLRAHWVGKHELGVAASAYSLMRLWEMPESKQLQAYFLARLAVGTFGGDSSANGAVSPNPVLTMLTDDLVDREWFLELRQPTNQPPQFIFAIRLDARQGATWRANLAGAFSSASGVHPTMQAAGWTLKHPRTQQLIELRQVGDWVLVGACAEQNPLLNEAVERIRRDGSPAGWQQAESWLEVDADLAWLAGQLQIPGTAHIPPSQLALTLTGDGAHALTRATVSFNQPLDLQLAPWEFPTNQITAPLVGFSAVRGLGGVMPSHPAWPTLGLAKAPAQWFCWAEAAAPARIHFAAPVSPGFQLAPVLPAWIQKGNAWLKENGVGQLTPMTGDSGLVWDNLPVFRPFLTMDPSGSQPWIQGGLMAGASPAQEVPPAVYPRPAVGELVQDLHRRTNVIAYAWETTGARAESFYLLSQVARVARLYPQLPAGAPSSQWIQAVRLRLGNATTSLSLTASNQVTLERRSTTGFTAAELHLLSDWLESPDFPRGLYSTRTRRAASSAEFQTQ